MKPSSANNFKGSTLNFLTLFGSASTLICCALPALLVSLGLGAVMAGLAANVPGLVWASENKWLVFSFAGAMLGLNGFLLWQNRNAPCPMDPHLREACTQGRLWSKRIYFFSLSLFLIGVFFAFIAPLIT